MKQYLNVCASERKLIKEKDEVRPIITSISRKRTNQRKREEEPEGGGGGGRGRRRRDDRW